MEVCPMVMPEQKFWLSGLRSKRSEWNKQKLSSFTQYGQRIRHPCSHPSPAKPTSASKQWRTSESNEIGVAHQTDDILVPLYENCCIVLVLIPLISRRTLQQITTAIMNMVDNVCGCLSIMSHQPVAQWTFKLLPVRSHASATRKTH